MIKFRKIPPAIVALVIQILSLGLLFGFWIATRLSLSDVEIVLLQAGIVLLLTRWFNLAWWWYVIQALFPLAIVLSMTLSVPPMIYFLAFSFLLVFYWSTFRTQVPYYPSTKKVWSAVEKWLPATRPVSFVDIGSGLGGLVMFLGRRHPESRFLGIEIAPLPWLVSYLRVLGKFGARKNAQFIRSNYEQTHFAQFDVVFAYLSPAAMPALWVKAKQEMLPGSTLISFEFPILGVEPDYCICPKSGEIQSDKSGARIYLWRM